MEIGREGRVGREVGGRGKGEKVGKGKEVSTLDLNICPEAAEFLVSHCQK